MMGMGRPGQRLMPNAGRPGDVQMLQRLQSQGLASNMGMRLDSNMDGPMSLEVRCSSYEVGLGWRKRLFDLVVQQPAAPGHCERRLACCSVHAPGVLDVAQAAYAMRGAF